MKLISTARLTNTGLPLRVESPTMYLALWGAATVTAAVAGVICGGALLFRWALSQ